jgi:transposase
VGDDRLVFRADAISDELWELVAPLMPSREGLRGRPLADHRLILEGIAWRFRTGSPWRDLPEEFGPWQTVWKRHHRFSTDGTYQLMFDTVRSSYGIDDCDDLARLLSIDSSVVRAHQHAAGAPGRPGRDMADTTDRTTGHTGGDLE